MRNIRLKIILILSLAALSCTKTVSSSKSNEFNSCTHSTVAKGSRVLGYDVLNLTETGTFINNITKAQALGIGYIQIHLYWNAIETDTDGVAGAPYTIGLADPNGTLAALNATAIAYGLKLSIIISPIDIPGRQVPALDVLFLELSGVRGDNV